MEKKDFKFCCYDCRFQDECDKFKEFENAHGEDSEELPEICDKFEQAIYRLTDFAMFLMALRDGCFITDDDVFSLDETMNNKFRRVFDIFKKRMTDNGYFVEDGQEKKEPKDGITPFKIFKKTLKGFGYKGTDDNFEVAWDSFVLMIEKDYNENGE